MGENTQKKNQQSSLKINFVYAFKEEFRRQIQYKRSLKELIYSPVHL